MTKRNGKGKPKAETAKEMLDRTKKRFDQAQPAAGDGSKPPEPAAAKANGNGGKKPPVNGKVAVAADAKGSSQGGKNGNGGVDTKEFKLVVKERDDLKEEVAKLTKKHLELESDLEALDNEKKLLDNDLKAAKGDLKSHQKLADKYVKLGKEIGIEVDPTLPAKEKAEELAKKIKVAIKDQQEANDRLRAQAGRRRPKPTPESPAKEGKDAKNGDGKPEWKFWPEVIGGLKGFWHGLTR